LSGTAKVVSMGYGLMKAAV